MKLRIQESSDIQEEYGVLYNFRNDNQLAVFYSKEEAYEFLNELEATGKDAFHMYDPDIMTKNGGFTVDNYGNSYYTATTPTGREYRQKIKVINTSPVYI